VGARPSAFRPESATRVGGARRRSGFRDNLQQMLTAERGQLAASPDDVAASLEDPNAPYHHHYRNMEKLLGRLMTLTFQIPVDIAEAISDVIAPLAAVPPVPPTAVQVPSSRLGVGEPLAISVRAGVGAWFCRNRLCRTADDLVG